MSVDSCSRADSAAQSRWYFDYVQFTPGDHADQALQDRAESLYGQVDQLLHRMLCENLSISEREQVYRYLEDLHRAWEHLHGDGHTYRNVREEYGGNEPRPGGTPEYLLDYCNDHYREFIELAETTLRLVEGFPGERSGLEGPNQMSDRGACGSTSGGPYATGPARQEQLTATRGGPGAEVQAEEYQGSWITDPSEVLSRYEADPEGFYQAFKEMPEEDRMLAMFSLQRAAQLNSQLIQMVSNLLQAYHESSMAVVRNLRA